MVTGCLLYSVCKVFVPLQHILLAAGAIYVFNLSISAYVHAQVEPFSDWLTVDFVL